MVTTDQIKDVIERIDNLRGYLDIDKKLIEISKRKGYAVGICHPYPGTVKALTEMVPLINNEVEVVSISNIINTDNKLGRN